MIVTYINFQLEKLLIHELFKHIPRIGRSKLKFYLQKNLALLIIRLQFTSPK